MKKWFILPAALIFIFSVAMPVTQADEHGNAASPENEIAQLKAAVEKLNARLVALEALKPSFTSFMPEFSERFHIMHRAGIAGDWSVATHELLELERMVKISKLIDPAKGRLMQAFMAPHLETINGAIGHGNRKSFLKALVKTVKSCNACHKAAGSPFIKVALNAKQYLTMRHSHILKKSKGMKGHAHKK